MKPDLPALVASLSPHQQLKALRLINDQFAWNECTWADINAACNQIENDLLADTAAANGYEMERAA